MHKEATLYRMVTPGHICPFGLKSKDLLKREGFKVDDRHLSTRVETDAFKQKHGVDTTPQTFIDGQRVGGYDELRRHFNKTPEEDFGSRYTPVIATFALAALATHIIAAQTAAGAAPAMAPSVRGKVTPIPARGGTGHQNRHRAHAGGPGARMAARASGPIERRARSAGSREKPLLASRPDCAAYGKIRKSTPRGFSCARRGSDRAARHGGRAPAGVHSGED